jgi:hypothetical protein
MKEFPFYRRCLLLLAQALIIILFVSWVLIAGILFVKVSLAQAAIGFAVLNIFWSLAGLEAADLLRKLVAERDHGLTQ